jgi:predicted nuclease of predicted toxin-antitoxin system
MNLLFDQNISFRIEKKLTSDHLVAKHVSSVGLNNVDDLAIWNFAKKEGFVIVTFDSDFYDISIINGCPPKIIWLRKGNMTTNEVMNLIVEKNLLIRNFIMNPDKETIACLEITD